jgi:AcrR family transcriptional regulator
MVEHGLDVSMDEIAARAQVARRTAFRYFATREDLLSAAIAAASATYLRSMPQYTGGDWLAWLADLARLMHQATIQGGRIQLEFTTRRLPERLTQVYHEHQQALHHLFDTIAATVWRAAGGDGATPRQLRQTLAAHLSPMFTHAVVLDADGTTDLAAAMATDAIADTVRRLRGQVT